MKPYKFSKEAGRYIPTTKKGNRKFYYKRLSKLVEYDFDPQSTFGKCIMKRLLGKLRFQRRCEKVLSSYNFDLERKKESLNEEVKEFESKTYRNYKFEINKTAEEQANREKWYLKPLKFIPLIVTVSYFIFFLQLNSPFGAVFFSAIIIYFFIRYPIKNHYDNIFKKYEHKARESYQKKKPDELVREFKIKKENEIKEIRGQIKISQAKLENVKTSIKNTFFEIISIDKIEFILSDDFYRSTDWFTIRNRVLNTHPNFCVKCKTREDLTVDHIQPRSKYPELALEISNTQILCRSCNSSKGNRLE